MLELLKSLLFAVVMVPVVMALILGLIYGFGEVFNVFSKVGRSKKTAPSTDRSPSRYPPASPGGHSSLSHALPINRMTSFRATLYYFYITKSDNAR